MDLEKRWQWLRDPENRGALKIVGGVVIAFCVDAWTVFLFIKQNNDISHLQAKSEKENSTPTREISSNTTNQTMSNSPGSVQAGRDLNINVNTDRRISKTAANILVQGLRTAPCPITIGVLGMGGEPDLLANDLFEIARQAGVEVHGVNHGVGFKAFTGIQVRYSSTNIPQVALSAITKALNVDNFNFVAAVDPGQAPGTIYVFVGYKP